MHIQTIVLPKVWPIHGLGTREGTGGRISKGVKDNQSTLVSSLASEGVSDKLQVVLRKVSGAVQWAKLLVRFLRRSGKPFHLGGAWVGDGGAEVSLRGSCSD